MKKSTLLSLLTAGAIVVTSAGTFAVWDQLTATSTGSISVTGESVTVEAGAMAAFTDNTPALGDEQIIYTSNATFTVDATDVTGKTMTLTPSVKNAGVDVDTGMYTIEIKKADLALTSSGADFTDTNVTKDANVYTVIVTITNKSLLNSTLDVTVTGVLS